MYGYLLDCLEKLILCESGGDVLKEIYTVLAIPSQSDAPGIWTTNQCFPDEYFYSIMSQYSKMRGVSEDSIMESFGWYFMEHARSKGYDRLLRCQSNNLQDWISRVNDIHMHLKLGVEDAKFSFPEIYCFIESVSAGTTGGGGQENRIVNTQTHSSRQEGYSTKKLLMYQKSSRGSRFANMTVGIITYAAEKYFNLTVKLDLLQLQEQPGGQNEFTVWRVTKVAELKPAEHDTFFASDIAGYHSSYENLASIALLNKEDSAVPEEWLYRQQERKGQILLPESATVASTSSVQRCPFSSTDIYGMDVTQQKATSAKALPNNATAAAAAAAAVIAAQAKGGEELSSSDFTRTDTFAFTATSIDDTRRTSSCGAHIHSDGNSPKVEIARSTSGGQQSSYPNHTGPAAYPPHLGSSIPRGISGDELLEIFPFHLGFNRDLIITQVGVKLRAIVPAAKPGARMQDCFTISTPAVCDWDWTQLETRRLAKFEIEPIEPVTSIADSKDKDNSQRKKPRKANKIILYGSMLITHDVVVPSQHALHPSVLAQKKNPCMAFLLVQPKIQNLEEVTDHNLTLSDFGRFSTQPIFILLLEHLRSEIAQSAKSKEEAISSKYSLEMKRMFVRYVSHEIRTPLNTVSVGLDLVQSMCEMQNDSHMSGRASPRQLDGHSIPDMVTEIKESCDIAIGILNDLLLYEKLEGGILKLEKKKELALKVIYDAVKTFNIQAKSCNIDLECAFDSTVFSNNEVDDPTVYIDIDKPKISQVLRNMVSNAIKFSSMSGWRKSNDNLEGFVASGAQGRVMVNISILDEDSAGNHGGGTATHATRSNTNSSTPAGSGSASGSNSIRSSAAAAGQKTQSLASSASVRYLHVEVIDFGPGISKENQDLLFQNIVQFDPNKLQGGGGSGLGLYISKGIMDLHAGSIGVFSEGEGKGSKFFINIPLAKSGSSVCSGSISRTVSSSQNKSSYRIASGNSQPMSSTESRRSPTNVSARISVQGSKLVSKDNSVMASPRGRISKDPSVNASTPSNKLTLGSFLDDWYDRTSIIMSGLRSGASSMIGSPVMSRKASTFKMNRDKAITLNLVKYVRENRIGEVSEVNTEERDAHEEDKSKFKPVQLGTTKAQKDKGQHEDTASASATGDDAQKPRVLVVDDSITNRRMVSRFLKVSKLADAVDEAEDGLEALNRMRTVLGTVKEYHAVLMDFVMPVMDGPAAAKAIRELGYSGLIVGLTGNVLPEDKAFFLENGATIVMSKPFDMKQLKLLITEAARTHVQGKPISMTVTDEPDDDVVSFVRVASPMAGILKSTFSLATDPFEEVEQDLVEAVEFLRSRMNSGMNTPQPQISVELTSYRAALSDQLSLESSPGMTVGRPHSTKISLRSPSLKQQERRQSLVLSNEESHAVAQYAVLGNKDSDILRPSTLRDVAAPIIPNISRGSPSMAAAATRKYPNEVRRDRGEDDDESKPDFNNEHSESTFVPAGIQQPHPSSISEQIRKGSNDGWKLNNPRAVSPAEVAIPKTTSSDSLAALTGRKRSFKNTSVVPLNEADVDQSMVAVAGTNISAHGGGNDGGYPAARKGKGGSLREMKTHQDWKEVKAILAKEAATAQGGGGGGEMGFTAGIGDMTVSGSPRGAFSSYVGTAETRLVEDPLSAMGSPPLARLRSGEATAAATATAIAAAVTLQRSAVGELDDTSVSGKKKQLSAVAEHSVGSSGGLPSSPLGPISPPNLPTQQQRRQPEAVGRPIAQPQGSTAGAGQVTATAAAAAAAGGGTGGGGFLSRIFGVSRFFSNMVGNQQR